MLRVFSKMVLLSNVNPEFHVSDLSGSVASQPFQYALPKKRSTQGLLIAATVIGLWTASLVFLFSLDVPRLSTVQIAAAIALRTFLYTGLFITAHDAMHGSLYPRNLQVNHAIGRVCLWLYALFPYQKLLKNHWQHHHHPASSNDPDFHDGRHTDPFSWYFNFVKKYCTWFQLIALSSLFNLLSFAGVVPEQNMILFWIVPSLLSSLQLFFFGIFLPHREPKGGYTSRHRTQSNSFPSFWSLITCYHFGYHEEHHEYPDVPWWQLPGVRRLRVSGLLRF